MSWLWLGWLASELVNLVAILAGLAVLVVVAGLVHHVLVTIPRRRRAAKGLPPRKPRSRTIGGGRPY